MEINSVSTTTVNRPTSLSAPETAANPAESTSSATSSATPEKKTSAAGGYISPFLRYDQNARVAVLLFRDIDSGETRDQIPSRRVVEEYRRAAGRLTQPDDDPASPQKGASAQTAVAQAATAQTASSRSAAGISAGVAARRAPSASV